MAEDRNRGYTFLETIMALAIAAMASLFAVGFVRPQVDMYHDFDSRSQAKALCGAAYVKLEKMLRYGYLYYVDPDSPETLSYYVPGAGTVTDGGLPPVERWPRASVGSLDLGGLGDMSLKLDFQGTSAREARAVITVMEKNEPIYEQEMVIRSMYDDQTEGDGVNG